MTIHVDNHFSDKFVLLYHVDDFINGDRQKLTTGYNLSGTYLSTNYTLRDKNDYLPYIQ